MTALRNVLGSLVVAAVACGCATTAEAPAVRAGTPGPLRNADFEADPIPGRPCPSSWWCTMHNDVSSFTFALATGSGARGQFVRVTRVKPEPWALVSQSVPVAGLAGKRIRLTVALNAEELDGVAGSTIIVQGAGGRVLGHGRAMVGRAPGWQRASTEIEVPAGAQVLEVGLLMEGAGSVGFDDVDFVVLPGSRP